MKAIWKKTALGIKAFRQLGWSELWPYIRYRLRLASGWLRLKTRPASYENAAEDAGRLTLPLFSIPEINTYRSLLHADSDYLLREAEQIISGQARLFLSLIHI